MKKKILLLAVIAFFILGMILLSVFLNSRNKVEISENKQSTAEVLNVTSANFEKEVLKSNKTVLIDFYADWCGPCKVFSPIVESVAQENENIKVVKVNVDNEQELAIIYQIMSLPTVVVIKNGQEVDRSIGMVSKSQLLELVK